MTGEVTLDPKDPATAMIALTIESASIDTGIGMRDKHLRSADFLDVARFPTRASG
jgi:polyisoprenoid-binding protein YceI